MIWLSIKLAWWKIYLTKWYKIKMLEDIEDITGVAAFAKDVMAVSDWFHALF